MRNCTLIAERFCFPLVFVLKPVTKELGTTCVGFLFYIDMIKVYLLDSYKTDDETVVFMVVDGFGTWFRIQVVRVFSYSLVLQISRVCLRHWLAQRHIISDFTLGCISVVVIPFFMILF